MRSRFMVIAKVACQNAAQMFVVEDDHVIETLATDASNDSLRVRILPRASCRGSYFSNAHARHSVLEVLPIDSISIMHQITWRLILRKGFDNLLCGPSCCRMFGGIKVNHSASFVRQHNEHKQQAQSGRWYGEKVDRHQIANVIIQEGSPRLGRCRVQSRH